MTTSALSITSSKVVNHNSDEHGVSTPKTDATTNKGRRRLPKLRLCYDNGGIFGIKKQPVQTGSRMKLGIIVLLACFVTWRNGLIVSRGYQNSTTVEINCITRNTSNNNNNNNNTLSLQSLQHKQDAPLGPIFYNFYVPENKWKNAIRIAREQQVERNMTAPNSPFWYTLIGATTSTTSTITNDFCQPNCHQREYLQQGDEVDTNQALWKYCIAHPTHIVTYTHNRGSFHPKRSNEKSRRFGTKAAFECRPILQNNLDNCNVCTSKFFTWPQFLASSNMWTAHCEYVRQLVAPKIYSASMKAMYDDTLLHPTRSQEEYACLKPQRLNENHLGINRYAAERWIFDHPYVKPCEIMPLKLIQANADFPQIWTPITNPQPPAQANVGTESFARLVGRLYQWQYLYGMAPPKDSWIWNAYNQTNQTNLEGEPEWLQDCLNRTGTTYEASINGKLLAELVPKRT